jgi:dTDP-3-amino-3,4,6-trideoxy-alpha-D-glucose transaminase
MNSKNSRLIVPFSDFKAAHDKIRDDVESAVMRVVKSGQYIMGKELSAFEEELANWLGVGAVVGVGNGTDALALAFMALEVEAGDEIITTDMTAPPTIAAIHQVGAVPKPVDIDPATGLLDANTIENMMTPRTRGLVPVHLYGRCCDMTAIQKIASENNLWIVEDCAQAIGARHSGRIIGSFGTLGALSFYPTKNLGAYGDAGALMCQDQCLAKRIRSLRNYGQIRPNEHTRRGVNSRLDEIQAAVLRAKLPYLQGWIERRYFLADRYQKGLPSAILPAKHAKDEHVYHLFPVLVPNRDHFHGCLQNAGIETMTHYPAPVHRQPVMGNIPDDLFPVASRWSAEVLSLPLYPDLSDESVDYVIESVTKVLEASPCQPR